MLRYLTLKTRAPGLYDLTPQLRAAVAQSGMLDGVCLIRAEQRDTGIFQAPCDADAGRDIWDDLTRLFGEAGGRAARTAVGGQMLLLAVREGAPQLGQSDAVYAAVWSAGREQQIQVVCFG